MKSALGTPASKCADGIVAWWDTRGVSLWREGREWPSRVVATTRAYQTAAGRRRVFDAAERAGVESNALPLCPVGLVPVRGAGGDSRRAIDEARIERRSRYLKGEISLHGNHGERAADPLEGGGHQHLADVSFLVEVVCRVSECARARARRVMVVLVRLQWRIVVLAWLLTKSVSMSMLL